MLRFDAGSAQTTVKRGRLFAFIKMITDYYLGLYILELFYFFQLVLQTSIIVDKPKIRFESLIICVTNVNL